MSEKTTIEAACEALRDALQVANEFPPVAQGGSVSIYGQDGKTVATRDDAGNASATYFDSGLRITAKKVDCPTIVSSR